jgi:cleavage and polyadenylation specificity factor subunit 1
MCVRSLQLETSEIASAIKPHVVVGTAVTAGEDLATKGHVYIYSALDVVPEPGKPETAVGLRLLTEEEVKGAVTGVSNIGREGFLMMAQGQKILVRGLKEDKSLLPVAFMDVLCFVTVCKELSGTGLCLFADAVKGLWFVGYQVSTRRLILLSRNFVY